MIRRRLAAAWRAFKDPSLLDHQPVVVVQHIVPEIVASPEPPKLLPRADGGRFAVYRWNPVTAQHETLYPAYAGQDSGAQARDVFHGFTLQYEGEYVVFMDGTAERGRR